MATTTNSMLRPSSPPSSPGGNFTLNNVTEALNTVESILRKTGYTNLISYGLRDGSHWIMSGISPDTGTEMVFYVKFQRELLYKARLLVKELIGTGTRGACTLNIEYAEKALAFHCKILFPCQDERTIYEVEPEFFMKNSGVRTQNITGELERCIAVEVLKPWKLAVAAVSSSGEETTPSYKEVKKENTVLLLKCLECGYARVQTKQDIRGTELVKILGWGEGSHSETYGHKMRIDRVSKSDPLALELRERLQPWEKWAVVGEKK